MGKKIKIHNNFLNLVIVFIILAAIIYIYFDEFDSIEDYQFKDYLEVYFIDVGQGDATLFVKNDLVILVDSGDYKNENVINFLEQNNIRNIDLLIGTHPHADHIGQMAKILERFVVKEVWLDGNVHTSKTFEKVIDLVVEKNIAYHEPRKGESYNFGDLKFDILHPDKLTADFNNDSIVIRAIYGHTSFLLTGDIEAKTETKLLESGQILKADILKMAHHGSKTSNTKSFIEKVNPSIAIYSAGKDNDYGHPHEEIVNRLKELQIPMYGTEDYGTIKIFTDGKEYWFETSK